MLKLSLSLGIFLSALGIAAAQEQRAVQYTWTFPGGNLIADWSFDGQSDRTCQPMEILQTEVDCHYPFLSAASGSHVMRVSVFLPSASGAMYAHRTDFLRVEAEADYALSAKVNFSAGASLGDIRPEVEFFNEAKQSLGIAPLFDAYQGVVGVQGSWSDYSEDFHTPAGTAFIRASLAKFQAAADCQLLFDHFAITAQANPPYVETRAYADAAGNTEKEVLNDGVNDVVDFTVYDAERRPVKRYAPVYGGVYRPNPGSGGSLQLFTVGVGLANSRAPDFATLDEAYAALVAWAIGQPADNISPDLAIVVAVNPADLYVTASSTLREAVSSDNQPVDFTLRRVQRGTPQYLELLAILAPLQPQPAPPPPVTIPSAYDDPESVVTAGTFGLNYPGESHFYAELGYPNPGVNTFAEQALPGAGYERTGGRTDRSGWAFMANMELLENNSPTVADIEVASSSLTETYVDPYFYQWSRDRQGNYSVSFTDAEGRLEKSAVGKTGGWITTSYTYDSFNRPVIRTSPEGKTITVSYDGRGRTVGVVDPDRGTLQSVFDDRDRLRFTRNMANGYFSVIKYDGQGRVLGVAKVTNLAALTQANADNPDYPANSLLEQGSVYDELTLEEFQDRTGLVPGDIGLDLAWLKNSQGKEVMAYKRNQEATVTGLSAVEKLVASFYAYDARGRLTALFQYVGPSPSGHRWHKIEYIYDEQDRLEQRVVYKDAGTTLAHRVSYQYDNRGRLSKTVDETGMSPEDTVEYTYDPFDRERGVALYDDLDLNYEYDIQGKTRSIEGDAGGQNIFAQYLGYEGLAHVELPGDAPASPARYDGKISSSLMKYSLGALSSSPVEYRTYDYLQHGPLSESIRFQGSALQAGNGEIDFSALPFGSAPAQSLGYAYDDDGGFTGRAIENATSDNVSLVYGYLTGTHQLESVTRTVGATPSTSTFTYDGEGRLVAQTGLNTKTINYDFMSMPVNIDAGGKTQHYFYGPDNFRVATYTEEASNITGKKVYVYEEGLKVVKEIRDDGTTVKTRVTLYGQGELIGVMDEETGEKRLFVKDHQGSVVQVIDDNGVSQDENFFADYGEQAKKVVTTDALNPSESWTGKEFEEGTGLYAFGYRHYDPEISTWTTPDAAAEFFNPYSYLGGDPINLVDPLGLAGDSPSSPIPGTACAACGFGGFYIPGSQPGLNLPGGNGGGGSSGASAGGGMFGIGGGASGMAFGGIPTLSLNMPTEMPRFNLRDAPTPSQYEAMEKYQLRFGTDPSQYNSDLLPTAGVDIGALQNDPLFQFNRDVGVPVGRGVMRGVEAATIFIPIGVPGQAAKIGIRGFTEHGVSQALTRGFKSSDILKIIREGKVSEQLGRFGKNLKFTLGRNTVVVSLSGRNAGKIISVFSDAAGTAKGLGRGNFIPLGF